MDQASIDYRNEIIRLVGQREWDTNVGLRRDVAFLRAMREQDCVLPALRMGPWPPPTVGFLPRMASQLKEAIKEGRVHGIPGAMQIHPEDWGLISGGEQESVRWATTGQEAHDTIRESYDRINRQWGGEDAWRRRVARRGYRLNQRAALVNVWANGQLQDPNDLRWLSVRGWHRAEDILIHLEGPGFEGPGEDDDDGVYRIDRERMLSLVTEDELQGWDPVTDLSIEEMVRFERVANHGDRGDRARRTPPRGPEEAQAQTEEETEAEPGDEGAQDVLWDGIVDVDPTEGGRLNNVSPEFGAAAGPEQGVKQLYRGVGSAWDFERRITDVRRALLNVKKRRQEGGLNRRPVERFHQVAVMRVGAGALAYLNREAQVMEMVASLDRTSLWPAGYRHVLRVITWKTLGMDTPCAGRMGARVYRWVPYIHDRGATLVVDEWSWAAMEPLWRSGVFLWPQLTEQGRVPHPVPAFNGGTSHRCLGPAGGWLQRRERGCPWIQGQPQPREAVLSMETYISWEATIMGCMGLWVPGVSQFAVRMDKALAQARYERLRGNIPCGNVGDSMAVSRAIEMVRSRIGVIGFAQGKEAGYGGDTGRAMWALPVELGGGMWIWDALEGQTGLTSHLAMKEWREGVGPLRRVQSEIVRRGWAQIPPVGYNVTRLGNGGYTGSGLGAYERWKLAWSDKYGADRDGVPRDPRGCTDDELDGSALRWETGTEQECPGPERRIEDRVENEGQEPEDTAATAAIAEGPGRDDGDDEDDEEGGSCGAEDPESGEVEVELIVLWPEDTEVGVARYPTASRGMMGRVGPGSRLVVSTFQGWYWVTGRVDGDPDFWDGVWRRRVRDRQRVALTTGPGDRLSFRGSGGVAYECTRCQGTRFEVAGSRLWVCRACGTLAWTQRLRVDRESLPRGEGGNCGAEGNLRQMEMLWPLLYAPTGRYAMPREDMVVREGPGANLMAYRSGRARWQVIARGAYADAQWWRKVQVRQSAGLEERAQEGEELVTLEYVDGGGRTGREYRCADCEDGRRYRSRDKGGGVRVWECAECGTPAWTQRFWVNMPEMETEMETETEMEGQGEQESGG